MHTGYHPSIACPRMTGWIGAARLVQNDGDPGTHRRSHGPDHACELTMAEMALTLPSGWVPVSLNSQVL